MSKRFSIVSLRQVSSSELFWRHLNTTSIHSSRVTDSVLCRLARVHGGHLRHLCVERARLLTAAAVSTLALMSPGLVSFEASGCREMSLGAIRFLCKSCQKLEVLKVAGCGEAGTASREDAFIKLRGAKSEELYGLASMSSNSMYWMLSYSIPYTLVQAWVSSLAFRAHGIPPSMKQQF